MCVLLHGRCGIADLALVVSGSLSLGGFGLEPLWIFRKTVHRMAEVAMQLEPRIRRGRVTTSKHAQERLEGPAGTSPAPADITFFYWAESLDEETAEQRVAALVRAPSPASHVRSCRTTVCVCCVAAISAGAALHFGLMVCLLLPSDYTEAGPRLSRGHSA